MTAARISFSHETVYVSGQGNPLFVLPLIMAAHNTHDERMFRHLHPNATMARTVEPNWFYLVYNGTVTVSRYVGGKVHQITCAIPINEIVAYAEEIEQQEHTPSAYRFETVYLALAQRVREAGHAHYAANILRKHMREGTSENTAKVMATLASHRPWWP